MLKHPKWQKMRLEVMARANFKCEKRGCDYVLDETNSLNVHHKYYDEENRWLEPWEYPRGSLLCLCEKHHREVHGIENKTPPDKKNSLLSKKISEIKFSELFDSERCFPNSPKTKRRDFLLGIINFIIKQIKNEAFVESDDYPNEVELVAVEESSDGLTSYHLSEDDKNKCVLHDRFLFLCENMGYTLGLNLKSHYLHKLIEKYKCPITNERLYTRLFFHYLHSDGIHDAMEIQALRQRENDMNEGITSSLTEVAFGGKLKFSFEQEFANISEKLGDILTVSKRPPSVDSKYKRESVY